MSLRDMRDVVHIAYSIRPNPETLCEYVYSSIYFTVASLRSAIGETPTCLMCHAAAMKLGSMR